MNEKAKAIMAATEWPTSTDAATADALIVHGARISVALRVATDRLFNVWSGTTKGTPEYTTALRDYLDSTTGFIGQSQVVVALVEVQKRDRAQADELARRIYDLTEDGGVLSELMWDYLEARGIDAQALWDAVEADETATAPVPSGGVQATEEGEA